MALLPFVIVLNGLACLVVARRLPAVPDTADVAGAEGAAPHQDAPLPPLAYCAAPWPLGSEGRLPEGPPGPAPGLELQQVQVFLRHGGRNSDIPLEDQVNKVEYTCGPARAGRGGGRDWDELFEVVDDDPASRDLPWVESDAAGACGPGQLTEQGVQQHEIKGRAFAGAYGGLLARLSPGDVAAQSTPYSRTRASVAAFLSGVLGGSAGAPAGGGRFRIHTASNIPSTGAPITWACGRSLRAGMDVAGPPFPPQCDGLEGKLAGIFNASSLLQHVDVLQSAICAGARQLPCGPRSCITRDVAEQLVECNGAWWAKVYRDRSDHCLGAYPLLEEIAARMDTNKSLVVYGDHDTGMMATACALGFADGMQPRIASHIAFELWRSQALPSREPYVRIVYNGVAVTDRLTKCSGQLCPRSGFVESIQDIVRSLGAGDYRAACAT